MVGLHAAWRHTPVQTASLNILEINCSPQASNVFIISRNRNKYVVLQRKTAVTAYLKSEQLYYCCLLLRGSLPYTPKLKMVIIFMRNIILLLQSRHRSCQNNLIVQIYDAVGLTYTHV